MFGGVLMSDKSCCFIGHRNVPDTEELRQIIKKTVEELIQKHGVTLFLFGSRSNFDLFCYDVVTELQETYPNIQRIAYTCRHEYVTMKENKEQEEQLLSAVLKKQIHIRAYDAEYEHPTKYTSGRASYVERNQAMINDSDFCVFYFDKRCLPQRRKCGKNQFSDYQPKSGTALAYTYAVQKKKEIYNLFQETYF